ncbi:MAG: proline dehydrogenase (proline oxidase) [Rhodospirillales bacterium]|nr:proline dehydrogenase (proline oxidase) [Rhodospirillales bacterium]
MGRVRSWSQVGGFSSYPVFTRKDATDVSYLACARALFAAEGALYPQFATHNAHSVASILELAGPGRGEETFEFQRLHGMGRVLYDHLLESHPGVACRVYAPVGGHRDLLAYLVRRLLENGANSSFVNRLAHDELPVAAVIAPPDLVLRADAAIANPAIPLPRDLYGERRNSAGVDLDDPVVLATSVSEIARATTSWPAVADATPAMLDTALDAGRRAQEAWDGRGAEERAQILERAADLYEANRGEFMALCVREAKKTLVDAVSEVREAVDYLRYYAAEARKQFAAPRELTGPTGERNTLALHGRGTFACISPWNFPLAIFTGQVAGALAAGNCVVAKPAEQTPRIAARAVALLHEAGVPRDVLHLTPGDGASVGAHLVADSRIDGVVFTGGFETAQAINRRLAARDGAIVPLIAETGGINAMIVDSTALPEQVVDDVIISAFRSAGQRCSALRLLIVQDDVADGIVEMLVGKARELVVGDPADPATDVGPVIDADALAALDAHAKRMDVEAKLLFCAKSDEAHTSETFFAPRIYEIARIGQLTHETFGPILHIVRYGADEIDAVIDSINGLGYGLTLGIQSRVESFATRLHARLRVGNIYVNRNIIGAVVGVQPFGGEGLSGTGPKAGGPQYLLRFAVERSLSVNTAAIGGNAGLLSGVAEP